MAFSNADPRYAWKLDDPQGGDITMLMQQVREIMTVNQEMKNESSWIRLMLMYSQSGDYIFRESNPGLHGNWSV